jgi:glycosyltransferase involved in cell wall biosynthesis
MMSCRVLVVTNMWPHEADPSYGAFVREQMESLRPLGVEYEVVFVNGRESRWNYLRGIFETRRRLKAERFDLVHAHFGLAGWVARFQRRAPVVVTFHGDDVMGQFRLDGSLTPMGRFYQISSRLLARRVAAVIVQSRRMKEKLGLDSARVLPCGVDLELFRPMEQAEARKILRLDARRKFVLFPYDRRVERKRFDVIQAAVELARNEVPELDILEVVGEPHARLPLYMNAADVFVLASLAEGSPVAVKEAMATNLPVVTVDVADTPELIGPTEGCHLVPREPRAIAEKIVEACRRNSRTRGRDWIARQAMENIARGIAEVYASVLGRPVGAADR